MIDKFVDSIAKALVGVPDGATVVFSAHGVAPAVRDEAARRGLNVIDATCPSLNSSRVGMPRTP